MSPLSRLVWQSAEMVGVTETAGAVVAADRKILLEMKAKNEPHCY